MSKEKKINIDKNRFKTPEGYFENISLNNLLLSNKNNFKTPLNYFETIKFDFSNQKTKSKRFLIKNIVYSGIAAIFIFGIVSNFYFTDSDNFTEDEIISYLNYDFIDQSISEYSEWFDETKIEINPEILTENEYEYFIETNFKNDDYIIFE